MSEGGNTREEGKGTPREVHTSMFIGEIYIFWPRVWVNLPMLLVKSSCKIQENISIHTKIEKRLKLGLSQSNAK